MPKSDNQKAKILYIMDYLEKNAHEHNPINAAQLIAMLDREHRIKCDRKTIYSDIAALEEFGLDVVSVPGRNGGYYFAAPKTFQLPELKLLIDAVLSSRYLTERKSRELIEKLCTQCNAHDAALMKRNVLVSGRIKSMNETILLNVDTIQEAITQGKQIRFRYFDWDLGGQRRYREKEYLASPYGLCQDHENCYLLAYSSRHGITSYRVDRMTHVEVSSEKRTPCPELTGKALHEHANRLFQMYSGELVDVKMQFDRELVNVVVDRFGKDTMLIPDQNNTFNFTAKVAISPMFLSWILGFGRKAKILYPEWVAQRCAALCREALSQYED